MGMVTYQTSRDYPAGMAAPAESANEILADTVATSHPVPHRSWVFRACDGIGWLMAKLFGFVSIVFCTSVMANIPVIQLLSLGYLLEVSGRIGRGGRWTDSFVGLEKASRIGGVLMGTWLMLIPIRVFSNAFWYESFLIDPASQQTQFLQIVYTVLMVLVTIHITTAWISGGRFRYFFWPLIAPISFGLWGLRKALGSRFLQPGLSFLLNWISPHLSHDIGNARPPADWFVPAIVWKKLRRGKLYSTIRDELWNFISSLRLWHYFRLGLIGLIGTLLWLVIPTLLLVGATKLQGPVAMSAGIFGILFAIPIFSLLPFIQAHYSRHQTLASFLDVRRVTRIFQRAPIAHVSALLLTLLFALPLFLLKIEPIPAELLWILSVVFMLFAIPSRMVIALAYRRGAQKESAGYWWIRWPIVMLAAPISAMFAVILSLTRYVSWHGAFSLIENHVFLLPAPFWLLESVLF